MPKKVPPCFNIYPEKISSVRSIQFIGLSSSPLVPFFIPITDILYLYLALKKIDLIAALRPPQSPPLVRIPIFFIYRILFRYV